MTKLNEMCAALTAYQPQADAAGHGISWAKMCKEKTYADADDAAAAADAALYAAAAYAAYAADAHADAEKWAQKAIDSINKVLIKPAQRKPLTDDQILKIGRELGLKCRLGGNPSIDFDYARAIEAAHDIKKENT